MTFLAPWALVVGALGAAGLVALHLVARQRPASYPLPTARFVPDRRSLVSRASRRPRDPLLLFVRLLLVLSAAVAFAQPVLTPGRSARTRVLLLDRSSAVADPVDAVRRARELIGDGIPTRVLAFDSAVVRVEGSAPSLDSLADVTRPIARVAGSLSAALAAARRAGAESGREADSVELVLISPLTEREWDAATDTVRALWPGNLRVLRVAPATDTVITPALERALPDADVLGPALGSRAVERSARSVRLVRGAPGAEDSVFARGGGVVVVWDSIGARATAPAAVAMGDDVFVASLARDSIVTAGEVLARWADGSPAAVEQPLGAGCVRRVGIGVPTAGDVPLRPVFQRLVRGLTGACGGDGTSSGAPVDSARMAALSGPTHAASAEVLSRGAERPAPITPWLLGLALACALAELVLRRSRGETAAEERAA